MDRVDAGSDDANTGTIVTVNAALKDYFDKWAAMAAERNDSEYFKALKPTVVGWKVASQREYQAIISELRNHCTRVMERQMNGRWIAVLMLRDIQLFGSVTIVEVLIRRPGSTDSLGLDFVDFYTTDINQADKVLQAEEDLKSTLERNDDLDDRTWLSIWFEGTEAKIKPYTVLDLVSEELQKRSGAIKAEA